MENKLVEVSFADASLEEKFCYVTYTFDMLEELSLAYATTVHKAQGSEFSVVVMPISVQQGMLLQKNLLYTGITRGKKLVFIVGQTRALKRAVQNNKASIRITNLKNRLQTVKEVAANKNTERNSILYLEEKAYSLKAFR